MKRLTLLTTLSLVLVAGSDYLDNHTLELDSDRIYGVREPEGFTPANLTCPDGANIVVTSVRFGYSDLTAIPLCGEGGPVGDQCVVSLDSSHVECQHNNCRFPSPADWVAGDLPAAGCGGGLQYWHICFDCSGVDYATAELINDDYADAELIDDHEYGEYGGGDDGYYYYYYSDMYHPEVTNRFDVEGYENIKCEHGDYIKILSTRFGYDEQSLKSNDLNKPCVFDFTQQFSNGLCTDTECKSPTLKQLGLTESVACNQSPGLGMWEIYYTCEKGGSIDTEEKKTDISHKLETHVGILQYDDLSTSVASHSEDESHEINNFPKNIEEYDIDGIKDNHAEIVSNISSPYEIAISTSTPITQIGSTTITPSEITIDNDDSASETTTDIHIINEGDMEDSIFKLEDVNQVTFTHVYTTIGNIPDDYEETGVLFEESKHSDEELSTAKINSDRDDEEEKEDMHTETLEEETTIKSENVKEENSNGWIWSWDWGSSSEENVGKGEVDRIESCDPGSLMEPSESMKPVNEKFSETDYVLDNEDDRDENGKQNAPTIPESTQQVLSDIDGAYVVANYENNDPNVVESRDDIVQESVSNENYIATTEIIGVENEMNTTPSMTFNKIISEEENMETSKEVKENPNLADSFIDEIYTSRKENKSKQLFKFKDIQSKSIEGADTEHIESELEFTESPIPTKIFTKDKSNFEIQNIKKKNDYSILEITTMDTEKKSKQSIDFEHSDAFINDDTVEKDSIFGDKVSTTETSLYDDAARLQEIAENIQNRGEDFSSPSKTTNHTDEHEYQSETEDRDQDVLRSTNRQFLETKHMADFSPQNATKSTKNNSTLNYQLNDLETRTAAYHDIESDKIDRHGAMLKYETTTLEINVKHYSSIIDVDRDNAEAVQEAPFLIDTDLIEQEHAEQRELEETLEKGSQTPGTDLKKTLENHKFTWQQTLGDQTTPGSLVSDLINLRTQTGDNKHQKIASNENVKIIDDSQHSLLKTQTQELEISTRKDNLVKPQANYNIKNDIGSKTNDETGANEILCKNYECKNVEPHNSQPSILQSYSDINQLEINSAQNYSNKNRGADNSTPLSMQNLSNITSDEALSDSYKEPETYDYKEEIEDTKNHFTNPGKNYTNEEEINEFINNIEKQKMLQISHSASSSDDKLKSFNPSNIIISGDRKNTKTENINPRTVKNPTKNIINNFSSQIMKTNITVDQNENYDTSTNQENNLKVSSFASENQILTSSMNAGLGLQLNDDTSLDQARNESLLKINGSIPTQDQNRKEDGMIATDSIEEAMNNKNQDGNKNSKTLADRKHRREKLLIQKGYLKSTKVPTTQISTESMTIKEIEITSTLRTSTARSILVTPRTLLGSSKTIKNSITSTQKTFTAPTEGITTSESLLPTATDIEKEDAIKTETPWKKDNGMDGEEEYTYSTDETSTLNVFEVNSESISEKNIEGDKIIKEAVTESTIEEEIEEEISHGIDQLKSELKMLLVFNHNVLNASNEIIKEATKAKVENFFESVSTSLNLLNFQKNVQKADKTSSHSKKTETKKKEEINTATSILNITADISKTLASTVELGSKVDIKLPNISMTVMKKKMGTDNSNSSSSWEADTLKVNLPDQSTIAGADSSITVSFTSYDNLGSMMSMDDAFSSSVLSVNVLGVEKIGNTIPLTKPMEFILRHKPMKDFSERKCVYWDFEEIGWSQKGCYAVAERSSENTTMCQCYHLTNFAVLVDVYGLAQSEQHKSNLDILTWIGCGISITSLSICIYVFSSFRSAKNDRSTINSNLCFCLLLAEMFFLCGIGQTGYPSFCSVVAAVLHYLFLASFFWMLIAGFQIYVLLVEVFEPDGSRFVQYYLLGYIAPLLIVLCSLLMDTLLNYESVYGFRDFCWINGNIHLVLTFLMPVFLIVGANIYFLCVAVYKIHIHSKESLIVHKSRSASLKLYVKGLFGLLFLLGVTWGFGIISVTHPSLTFTYIFTILNSLHGFFIFIFNCVMNKKIRNEGRNKIEDALSCLVRNRRRHLVSRKESTLSNISASSATSNTNSTMVKEYFLPERMPYTIEPNNGNKKKQNALSITYYY